MAHQGETWASGSSRGARETASVALGSNVGDREAHLRAAVEALSRLTATRWRDASRVYETQAVGGPQGQGPYLNAVVRLDTQLSAPALLGELLAIERGRGRARTPGVSFAPRTLDLDLLLYGQAQIEMPDLTVPHPRLASRRFVLVPLCDLAADELHPGCGESFARLLARLEPGEDVRPVGPPLGPKNTL